MRWLLCAALLLPALAPAADFAYVARFEPRDEVVIDARPLADCLRASLPNARCLPADGFLGPHRRLPSERDLLWLLGTAGLDGSETVLVVGQDAMARDFVAGLLYLAGQRDVHVLTEPLHRVQADSAPGRERGIVRAAVWTAAMRERLWVLKDEVLAGQPLLLDGRTETEYWGEVTRATRGGHLPGALRLPAVTLTPGAAAPAMPSAKSVDSIAYAHDAYEGIAYFTRLTAGHALPVRVYPGGWAEWAADGSLPADAVSYPERQVEAPVATPAPAPSSSAGPLVAILLAATGTAFAGGWVLARRRTARWT